MRRKEQHRRVMNRPQPRSPSHCTTQEGGREKSGVKLWKPGKKGGVGEGDFKIWFYYSLSHSDSIGDKLH